MKHVISLLILTGLLGAGTPDDPRREDSRVVDSVDATISFSMGQLTINDRTNKLMDLTVSEDADEKPQVNYEVERGLGRLTIRPESGSDGIDHLFSSIRARNEWTVNLNPEIPYDLKVESGMGETRLDLGTMQLRRLEVAAGVGETVINLEKIRLANRRLKVEVAGGIGEIRLNLPKEYAIKLYVERGIGDVNTQGFSPLDRDDSDGPLVNEAFQSLGAAEIIVEMNLGVGSCRIRQY